MRTITGATDNDDKKLVIRLQRDDQSAFDLLFYKYRAPLYRNILKLLKDEIVAQDILQDVFFSLWEKRSTLNPEKGVASWLFVTSYNKSISSLKQMAKAHLAYQQLITDWAESDTEPQITEHDFILLQEAISRLSPQKKKAFQLCKLDCKTYEEAAKEMGISRHTVKEYLSDAVASIKVYVERYAVEHSALVVLGLLILVE